MADCESLQKIYGPQVEANQNDSTFLKKAISVLKMMKCTESEAYFQASYYMYKINPTADAAVGCGYQAYKKGDYDTAVKYFDEAINLETDNAKKAEMAYAAAAAMFGAKSGRRYVATVTKLLVSMKTLVMLISCWPRLMVQILAGVMNLP